MLNALLEYAKANNEQVRMLFKVAEEHTLHPEDLKALIKEFGYQSFADIPDDKLNAILNAIPEYADNRSEEILNEFKEIYG